LSCHWISFNESKTFLQNQEKIFRKTTKKYSIDVKELKSQPMPKPTNSFSGAQNQPQKPTTKALCGLPTLPERPSPQLKQAVVRRERRHTTGSLAKYGLT
jgi:hypothetical protein